ncbi:hypothetical protein [Aeromonas salmonicida]|uniref:hypothetical protein n=1 Tax=Aeromonas salmonicida TaxID=645 RepID=UPI00232A7C11|nr:hypothetical protein [Aeromonas salmonicida]WCH24701.1 hypothetical protein ONZ54_10370 [Aeromonas salmonicida]
MSVLFIEYPYVFLLPKPGQCAGLIWRSQEVGTGLAISYPDRGPSGPLHPSWLPVRDFLLRINMMKVTNWHWFYALLMGWRGVNRTFIQRLNSLQKQKTGVTLGYKTRLPRIGTFFVDACKRFQSQRKRS